MSATAPWPKPLAVLAHPRAYGAALYALLSLAAGILAFTWVTTGLSLSVGLMPLIIGPVVALAFLLSVRALGRAEQQTLALLTGDAPEAPLAILPAAETKGRRILKLLTDAGTWRALLFLALRLPLGIAGFTAVVTGSAVGATLFAAPAIRWFHGPVWVELGDHAHLMGYPEAFLYTLVGLVLLVATLHGALLFLRAHAWLGGKLLR